MLLGERRPSIKLTMPSRQHPGEPTEREPRHRRGVRAARCNGGGQNSGVAAKKTGQRLEEGRPVLREDAPSRLADGLQYATLRPWTGFQGFRCCKMVWHC